MSRIDKIEHDLALLVLAFDVSGFYGVPSLAWPRGTPDDDWQDFGLARSDDSVYLCVEALPPSVPGSTTLPIHARDAVHLDTRADRSAPRADPRAFHVKRCSRCRQPRSLTAGQRYCRRCHATYMRSWRRSHAPSEEQRRRGIARRYLGVYVSRGKIERPKRCEDCGRRRIVQAHHHDYTRPLDVAWLCRPCHSVKHHQVAA